jgi:type I restriction enzyme S subunit
VSTRILDSTNIGRWKRYPEYKYSGVSYLGAIPTHWNVLRLKWAVSKIGSGKTPRGGSEVYSETGVLFLRSQNIHFGGLRLDDVVYIDDTTDAEMPSTRVLPQDVLLNIIGASLGRCCIVPVGTPRANVNQHVCILRPKQSRVDFGFLNASIASPAIQSQIFSSENGVSREGLNYTQTANLILAMPPDLREQRAIASFLDRETARIDALIGYKERLIALLEEKRQAVISNAVTRGLDPAARIKDSGAPWMGMVPNHWRIISVRQLIRNRWLALQDGNHGEIHPKAEDYTPAGIPFILANNLRNGLIDTETCKFISEAHAQRLRIGFHFLAMFFLPTWGQSEKWQSCLRIWVFGS